MKKPNRATSNAKLTANRRQVHLLELLSSLGGHVKPLDFQKLLFLYCKELRDRAPYEFIPYQFGAFSFTSYADRRKLVEAGLLAEESDWRITEEGRNLIALYKDQFITAFARRHKGLRGDSLVAKTYRRYPFYATRSEIADRVLSRDKLAMLQVKAARPNSPGVALFTIGYQGRTLDGYLNILIREGVTLLCDVRHNPISRKYGFAQNTLRGICEKIGITYQNLPELGIPSSMRKGTVADYKAMFINYQLNILPKQDEALKQILTWLSEGNRVALTCFERLNSQCHRQYVATAIHCRLAIPIEAKHL